MEVLQPTFFSPVDSIRSHGFLSPPCETCEGRPSQETKGGDERDGRDPSLPRSCLHKLGDDAEPGGDPHRFRSSEFYSRNHQTRNKKCWKDFDNLRSSEGVTILFPRSISKTDFPCPSGGTAWKTFNSCCRNLPRSNASQDCQSDSSFPTVVPRAVRTKHQKEATDESRSGSLGVVLRCCTYDCPSSMRIPFSGPSALRTTAHIRFKPI